jgi:hypothetical protein
MVSVKRMAGALGWDLLDSDLAKIGKHLRKNYIIRTGMEPVRQTEGPYVTYHYPGSQKLIHEFLISTLEGYIEIFKNYRWQNYHREALKSRWAKPLRDAENNLLKNLSDVCTSVRK